MKKNNGRRGFTLVEIIVSLAIIAVLMPPIMYGLNLASGAAALARNRTQAGMLAQRKLDELLAIGPLENDSGQFDEPWAQYKWTSEIVNFDSPTVDGLTTTLEELDVHVSWKQDGQDREIVLSTLIYNTPTSTAGGTSGLTGGLP